MTVTVAPSKAFDSLKSRLSEQQKDPDEGHEEFDVWLESDCGKSSVATVPGGQHTVVLIWGGEACRAGCLELKCCRVGSDRLLQALPPIGQLPPEAVVILGTELNIQVWIHA